MTVAKTHKHKQITNLRSMDENRNQSFSKPVFPDLAKIHQMGEIQVLGGDGFFADGDGEIWLQNSQKWAKLDKFAKIGRF